MERYHHPVPASGTVVRQLRTYRQDMGSGLVNLSEHPGVYDRQFWSIDRLHPSELGHRALADEFAVLLEDPGCPSRARSRPSTAWTSLGGRKCAESFRRECPG